LLVPLRAAIASTPRAGLNALASWYESHLYETPSSGASVIGIVRRGTVLRVIKPVRGSGCKRGLWYAVSGGAACTSKGFIVGRSAPRAAFDQRSPVLSRPLPFRYGRVKSRTAQRYVTIPSVIEERRYLRATAAGKGLPASVKQLDGDYFVAIDREQVSTSRTFYRTVRGRYVRKDKVDLKSEPGMRGELLSGAPSLPLAFVFSSETRPGIAPQGAPLFARSRVRGGAPQRVGEAAYHSRFRVHAVQRWGKREVAVTAAGLGVARDRLRIAAATPRPARIGRHDKWIHVNLDEQTLVAYRGDRPVFATLVSSGRTKGYATPPGLFRIREKHVTTTMRGVDPVDGPYEVGDVPWTMYYSGSYALHGAYWHDSFGRARSHGCTNLSPIDARWLFRWTEGALPAGWHGARGLRSTWVYLTSRG
jgi:lipoprotein-anchoring transpeptidase ErfK/SrfK